MAPYTFMFYLWHTIVMETINDRIEMDNIVIKYFIVLVGGFFITAYIAWLSTKMNNSIISPLK